MLSKKLLLLSMSSALMLSCSGQEKNTAAPRAHVSSGIIGGSEVPSDSFIARSTFFLSFKYGDGYAACTATLIDRRIALTAAHCVGEEMVAVFGSQPKKTDVLHRVPVEKAILHPAYTNEDSKERGDIALLLLSREAPADVETAALIDSWVSWKSFPEIITAGYGRTSDSPEKDDPLVALRAVNLKPLVGDYLHQAKMQLMHMWSNDEKDPSKKPSGVSATSYALYWTMFLHPHDRSELIFLYQAEGKGVCSGDSGGPSFVMVNGQPRQIGVASFVANGGDDDTKCQLIGAYSSVAFYRDWITETAQNIFTLPGKNMSKKAPTGN